MHKNYETMINKPYIFISLFIIVGIVFCDIPAFTDSDLKSKWYWLCLTTAISGLFLYRSQYSTHKKDLLSLSLILLFFIYGLFRTIGGLYTLSFLINCTLFILIYFLSEIFIYNQFKTLAISITITAFFLALYGLGQAVGIIQPGEIFKIEGGFDNPTGYASALSLSTPFILYLTFSERKKIRIAAWCIFIIVSLLICLSASRSGIFALMLIIIFYTKERYKSTFNKIKLWKKIIASLSIVIILTGLYFFKQDSANGRLLIWNCTWKMIQEKPLFGHGYKSFEAKYMIYQAHYFKQNPNSKFILLADNIKHPFNEFLKITSEFGIIAILLLFILTWRLIKFYNKNKTHESFVFISTFLAIIGFSCFSYPFSYPFTWFVLAYSISGLSTKQEREITPKQFVLPYEVTKRV